MRGISASIFAMIIGPALAFAVGTSGPMQNGLNVDGAMIWLAQAPPPAPPPPPAPKKKAPPPVVQPVPNRPAGASAATKGQKGTCICSTNAAGTTMCTGAC